MLRDDAVMNGCGFNVHGVMMTSSVIIIITVRRRRRRGWDVVLESYTEVNQDCRQSTSDHTTQKSRELITHKGHAIGWYHDGRKGKVQKDDIFFQYRNFATNRKNHGGEE